MNGADEDSGEELALAPTWQPQPWWAYAGGLTLLAIVLLGWSARLLDDATLGNSLRSRACDGGALAALASLVVASLAVSLALVATRLRHDGALLGWDWTLPLAAAPVPLVTLLFAAPGAAGCRAARSLDELPLLGDALVGDSGLVIAGAAAALLGAAVASIATVSWLAPAGLGDDDSPGIVEQRMLDAEAFEAERERFHGVDPLR